MPAITSTNSKILVTGVTGYIGAWTAQQLLEKGYSVRGTVRDTNKAKELSERFSKYGEKFELATVKDLEAEGAFDEAVKGVDGILHIASPFHLESKDPQEVIGPAVKGTLSVLTASHQYGKDVKRVVVTSSYAAMMEPHEGPHVYTENDWNEHSSKLVKEKGGEAGPMHAYLASKTEAEKAAWNFVAEKKPNFDLVVLNPVYVFGPFIHPVKDAQSINTSVGLVFNSLNGGDIPSEGSHSNFVDVRDVAKAHVVALEKPEASGKRFILSSSSFGYQQINGILRKHFPESKAKEPKNPAAPGDGGQPASNEQAKKILGLDFIPLEQSIKDTAQDLKRFL